MIVVGKYGGWIKVIHKHESPTFYEEYANKPNRKTIKPLNVNKVMPSYDLSTPRKEILIEDHCNSPKFMDVVENNTENVLNETNRPSTNLESKNFSEINSKGISPHKDSNSPRHKEMFVTKVEDNKISNDFSFDGEKENNLVSTDWNTNFKNELIEAQSSNFEDQLEEHKQASNYDIPIQKLSDDAVRTDEENHINSVDVHGIRQQEEEAVTSFRERIDTERQEFLDE